MKMVVAVDKNLGIGYEDGLLFRVKEDMQHFKNTTTDGVMIMGRKTHFSMANGKALPNRIHIVLSTQDYKNCENVYYVKNVDEAIELANSFDKEIYVVGGNTIYNLFIPFIKEVILTEFNDEAEHVDTYLSKDIYENLFPYKLETYLNGYMNISYNYLI